MRIEQDFIGVKKIKKDALYGINSLRANENFPDKTPFHKEWYSAVGAVKLAYYTTYKNFCEALKVKYGENKVPVKLIDSKINSILISTAKEVKEGKYFDDFIVPAISGGAGTSINMNVNEIIANASLIKMNKKTGDYNIIDPIEHCNIFQSTNDVVPTALRVATMSLLNVLEESINVLRSKVESYENKFRDDLRIAYTQMQEAVPSSYGRLFSTYNEALSRDWWRVSKCFERIKVVNLGGSAVGTGLTVPRYVIMEVVKILQQLTRLPVSKSENLSDATNNLDSFVEIHATLKSHAVNLEKMVSDLRLLASDLIGRKEITIPQKQVGSSIMPQKINPVIPEFVISAAHKIYANDNTITSLCAQGCLELNAYLPIIGHSLLDSIKLLIAANKTLTENLFDNLQVNSKAAYENLINSASITTALLPFVGYNEAAKLSKEIKEKKIDVFQANKNLKIIDEEKLREILKPENLLKEGYSVEDLKK